MDVYGAVYATVVFLECDPVLQGTHVVTQMEQPGGPHAGEDHTFVAEVS